MRAEPFGAASTASMLIGSGAPIRMICAPIRLAEWLAGRGR
jgi:hypothetical protein